MPRSVLRLTCADLLHVGHVGVLSSFVVGFGGCSSSAPEPPTPAFAGTTSTSSDPTAGASALVGGSPTTSSGSTPIGAEGGRATGGNDNPTSSGGSVDRGGSSNSAGGATNGGEASGGASGSRASGGVTSGGTSANGGRASSGGTQASGGNPSGGSSDASGGRAAGGTSGRGGTTAAGGKAAGGTSARGGSTASSRSGAGSGGCLDGPAVVVPAGYRLVWSDEFNVDGAPDSSNWGYENGFVRNEEAQWYQPNNAWVEKGCLIVEARRERKLNPNYQAGSSSWKTNRQYAEYTSSSLHTSGKRTWQYGRFEMRGRIKTQAGLWPAWWTLGVSGEWPSNGEIDIMEYYGGMVRANVACGTTTRWQAKWDSAAWNAATFEDKQWESKFHVWRMDWNSIKIDLYLDDKLVNTSNLSAMLNPDGSSPFKQPHYMLVNLAIGGNNGGNPSGTAFPTRYEVDYIRVFQTE